MASVFKKGPDKDRKGSCYYVGWTDEHGKRRMRKAFRDKGLSAQLGAKLENEVMLRTRGLIDPQLDQLEKSGNSPLVSHLAEYKSTLQDRGTTEKHIKLAVNRLTAVFEGCQIRSLKEIKREPISKYLHGLKNREERPIGHRTFNHYVQTLNGFCRWLVTSERLNKNPLIGLESLNAEVDVRHRRRALNPEEMSALIEGAATSGKNVQCYSGELRARLYLFSYLTGLRRKELASLTAKSFNLTSEPPLLTVEAACSKHRKQDVLPLHSELVRLLGEWLPLCHRNLNFNS